MHCSVAGRGRPARLIMAEHRRQLVKYKPFAWLLNYMVGRHTSL